MPDVARDRLKAKTLAGIGWQAIARALTMVLQMISSTVVARNLSSSDVGLVGFANIFTGFLSRFSYFGLDSAIVQRKRLDGRVTFTAFTLKAGLGAVAFLAALLFAPLARVLIGHDEAGAVVVVLSTTFVLNTFAFLPTSLLTRALDYRRLMFVSASSALARFALLITLVLLGFRYWSIVIADVGATLISVIILNVVHPVALRLHWDRPTARDVMGFGGPLFCSSVLAFLVFNVDNFAIGAILGPEELGYYVIAFNWGSLVCVILYDTVNSVLFPTFAKVQDDRDITKRLYLKTLSAVGFLAVLTNTCLLATARDFLVVVLGRGSDKWLPALTCLHVLALYGMIRALTEPVANVILSAGKPKLMLVAGVLAAVIELGLMAPVLRDYGIDGVAVLVTLAYGAQLFLYVPFLVREVSISGRDLMRIVLPLALASGAAVFVTSVVIRPADPSWIQVGLRVLVSASTFTLLHGVLTSFKVLREVVGLTSGALSKAERRRSALAALEE